VTAEVTLLNRAAVALAADSATTVTYWEGGQRRVRFFKGANKIFNISDQHPVGMMIYDAGSLEGMPWEVISKAYRTARGHVPRSKLGEYADDLFDFIQSEGHIFPREYQENQLISRVVDSFMRVSYVIRVTDEDKKTVKEEDRPEKIREKFRIFCGAVADDSFIDGIDQEFIDKHVEPFYDKVFAGVSETPVYKNVNGAVDPKEIFRIAAAALFKKGFTTLPTTGLIIAGYGQSDYFPQLSHYTCYGIFLGKILCVKNTSDTTDISHNNVSEIKDFAQSEMVKTFIYGASIEALVEIDRIFVKTVDAYTDALVKAGHLKAGLDLEDAKVAAKTNFSTQTSSYLSTEHSRPLRNVIGMLSVDELAELAETLISIESLKERVTRPTESVSGPIDVAVISKADGFIWIKRKHYFDPALNPRFFARKGLSREH
jgi:hypothetical protein